MSPCSTSVLRIVEICSYNFALTFEKLLKLSKVRLFRVQKADLRAAWAAFTLVFHHRQLGSEAASAHCPEKKHGHQSRRRRKRQYSPQMYPPQVRHLSTIRCLLPRRTCNPLLQLGHLPQLTLATLNQRANHHASFVPIAQISSAKIFVFHVNAINRNSRPIQIARKVSE